MPGIDIGMVLSRVPCHAIVTHGLDVRCASGARGTSIRPIAPLKWRCPGLRQGPETTRRCSKWRCS
eukprot:2000667-Rhodomonas_salina.2